MARWMINCQEHSRLTSESMDRSLSFWDRLSVRIHRWICPPCKQLRQQFEAIRKACRLYATDSEGRPSEQKGEGIVLPDNVHHKMKSVLREHLK